MKKTLIASAVAAATFSGAALAQESNLPTVYGNIQYALAYDAIDNGPNSLEHFDNGTTLGVKHEHVIAPGFTGFFKLELEGINADDKSYEDGIDDLDEAYIGVKGDSFGQLWVGSDDSTYETAVDYIVNFYEVASLNIGGSYTTGEGDLIQYKTPSFGGLTFGGAVQINGDGDDQAGGDKSYPYQLSAMYEMNGLTLAVAMDSNDGNTGYSSGSADDFDSNENTYGVRAAYALDNLLVSAEYQTRKDAYDKAGVIGVYTLGANQVSLAYELRTNDYGDDDKTDTITLQALHNLSDHMYVYFEGYLGGGDDVYEYEDDQGNEAFSDERSVASVGAVYYF
ncbi:porin [Marinobacter fonticola]|uniref:porin n=1 Tax=Marinobacter fonticola TaxID=2603215 RepID=UPI0011E6D290|nr:porin [Marinobacter fonticola]